MDEALLARKRRFQRMVAVACLIAGAVIWVPPSDVVRLVILQDTVLLGRYSVERFTVLATLTTTLWLLGAILLLARDFGRKFWFRTTACLLSSLVTVAILDTILRQGRKPRYIERATVIKVRGRHWPGGDVYGVVRHRPPNTTYQVTYKDRPPGRATYPSKPRGFSRVNATLTTDRRGFRNQAEMDRCDIVTLGDSFVEGAFVSDHEAWPVLLGNRTRTKVYNLGISGGSPQEYAANFIEVSKPMRPQVVVVMLYEGNDFKRASNSRTQRARRFSLNRYIKASPLIIRGRRLMTKSLSRFEPRVDSNHPAFQWMPLTVEAGKKQRHYVFEPKRLLRLLWTKDKFRKSREWKDTASELRKLQDACGGVGCRMVVAYAPSKPHVLVPLVRANTDPSQLRAFAACERSNLPDAAQFARQVYRQLDNQEHVVREFCEANEIDFVSVTSALRKNASNGIQVYFTYDQHWTRLGHRVAAGVITRHLKNSKVALRRGDRTRM